MKLDHTRAWPSVYTMIRTTVDEQVNKQVWYSTRKIVYIQVKDDVVNQVSNAFWAIIDQVEKEVDKSE